MLNLFSLEVINFYKKRWFLADIERMLLTADVAGTMRRFRFYGNSSAMELNLASRNLELDANGQ